MSMLARSFTRFLFVGTFILCSSALSMIDTARYFPMWPQLLRRVPHQLSVFDGNFFVLIGHNARLKDDREASIADLYGRYDLATVANALETIGKPNPIKTQWRGVKSIPFDVRGKLEGYGLWGNLEFAWNNHVATGVRGALLWASVNQAFIISRSAAQSLQLDRGGDILLDAAQRKANEELGLCAAQAAMAGPTDTDFYLRFFISNEYTWRCRAINAGLTLGCLAPTGLVQDINNPASIPFGGNGHTGLYVMGDATIELRDDIVFACWLEFLHRFKKIERRRMPVAQESMLFGALVGDADIDPGFTFGATFSLELDGLRDGLGVRLGYTIVDHLRDSWCAMPVNGYAPQLAAVQKDSHWIAEYFTVGAVYVLDQISKRYTPTLYLTWDLPIHMAGSRGVSESNRIAVGVDITF